ncbi:uncharacterized protein Z518_09304 [Rhinocladiella mackenziei CBS 650.93]|uniref:Nucleolar protein 12 n=1 Tax=Rhinocladiella mackenziei CBS 650.93 TaxID=1442369 RepID=A0A0D2GTD8_9EURO|nr:uncharacterized protein Z518_09304 [Rhinocladiella mackenziei CBS 650.93]KIX01578.1 hypothetical protein Z518_09304 [Rhinocladiella mackenziei CBS 650.93]
MEKSRQAKSRLGTTAVGQFEAKADIVDPVLASLFASSSGPVKIPARSSQPTMPSATSKRHALTDEEASSGSSTSEESVSDDSNCISEIDGKSQTPAFATEDVVDRPRKRRRLADGADIEDAYFKRLEREEEKEQRQKRVDKDVADDGSTSDEDSTSSSDSEESSISQPSIDDIPQHETLATVANDREKLKRTVFLGNVSTEAIKSKAAKRTLTRHLRSVLKTHVHGKRPGKLESVRFRSTAYARGSGPKKATFAKKELMDQTTTSTNAYAVFTSEVAAELVAEKLNGSMVLGRHLRVDYLGHPTEIDHRRCVFIGNLSFVNEEAVEEKADADGPKKRRPTAKEPADAEEGLWRTFGKAGAVESVRVVRDQETRVGKGFAYIQFKSGNSVENALLMNDKKFPPMLPRRLRVMRARRMKQKSSFDGSKATSNDGSSLKRRGGIILDTRSVRTNGQPKGGFVFEGHRATNTSQGKPVLSKNRHKRRPTTRSSRRGAAYKAAQKKHKREGQ